MRRLFPARWPWVLTLACCLLPGTCASVPADPVATTKFLLVRHAEKASDDKQDPSLSAAGQRRAGHLAEVLADERLSAIYSTDYRRTRATAQPTSASHGIEVTIYDADQPAAAFTDGLRQRHEGGAVLVVGHSNTIPGIASALCECEVPPLDESEYGDLYTVTIEPDKPPVLARSRY